MIDTPYIWPFLLSAGILTWMAVVVSHLQGMANLRSFGWLLWLAAGAALIQGLAYLTPDLTLRILWAKLIIIPAAFLPLTSFLLVLEYTGNHSFITRKRLAVLSFVPVLSVVLSLTSSFHPWFHYDFYLKMNQGVPLFGFHIGFFYYIYYAYSILLGLGGLLILFSALSEPRLNTANTWIVAVSIGLPLLCDVLLTFGVINFYGINLTPISFVFSGLLLFRFVYTGRLFLFSNVARRMVVDNLDVIVLVEDMHHHIVDFNLAAQAACGLPDSFLGSLSSDLPARWAQAFQQRGLNGGKNIVSVEHEGEQSLYEMTCAPVLDGHSRKVGWIYTFHDITDFKRVEEALGRSEQLYRSLFEKAGAVKLLVDPQTGSIVDANEAAAEFYGYPLPHLKTMNISAINILPFQVIQAEMQKAFTGKQSYFTFSHRLASGDIRFVEVYSSSVDIDGRQLLHSIVHDITARRSAEIAEREQRDLAEALRDTAAALNSTLKLDDVLDKILENVGRVARHHLVEIILLESFQEIGWTVRLRDLRHPDQSTEMRRAQFYLPKTRNLREVFETGQPVIVDDSLEYEGWVTTEKNGWVRSNLSVPIKIKGTVTGFLCLNSAYPNFFTLQDADRLMIFADQAGLAIANARLYEGVNDLATTDSLTGLYNRYGLIQLGEHEIERALRFMRPLAIILLDLDHFKAINDTYGHPVGDRVLVELAKVCREQLRKVDILTRYGGEEFIFILPETDLDLAVQVAEHLRQKVEEMSIPARRNYANQTDTAPGEGIKITASLGVVEMTPDISSLAELIERVDLAMYDAKHTGRNRVAIVEKIY